MNHGQGTEVLIAATSDHLPCHPAKGWRATDSCFALIGARQCGVLIDNPESGLLAVSMSTTSVSLVVSTETDRGYQSKHDCAL